MTTKKRVITIPASLKSRYRFLSAFNDLAFKECGALHSNNYDEEEGAPLAGKGGDGVGASTSKSSSCTPKGTAVPLTWPHAQSAAPGLKNIGNTCYINSVVQTLSHTAPLAVSVLSGLGHAKRCTQSGCWICAVEEHISNVFSPDAKRRYTFPRKLVHGVGRILETLRDGRQEDAHEYMLGLLNAMDTDESSGYIRRFFGGQLRNRTLCLACKNPSDNFEPFLDLSIEVRGVGDIENALRKMTASESLTGDNKYKCDECDSYQNAKRTTSISTAPPVIALHLKRFAFCLRGGRNFHNFGAKKLSRKVHYPLHLKLDEFLADEVRHPGATYELYSVITHLGHDPNFGHYVSYIRAPSGDWKLMDDEKVKSVPQSHVLNQEAYMLFYVRKEPMTKQKLGQPPFPKARTSRVTVKANEVPVAGSKPVEEKRADLMADEGLRSAVFEQETACSSPRLSSVVEESSGKDLPEPRQSELPDEHQQTASRFPHVASMATDQISEGPEALLRQASSVHAKVTFPATVHTETKKRRHQLDQRSEPPKKRISCSIPEEDPSRLSNDENRRPCELNLPQKPAQDGFQRPARCRHSSPGTECLGPDEDCRTVVRPHPNRTHCLAVQKPAATPSPRAVVPSKEELERRMARFQSSLVNAPRVPEGQLDEYDREYDMPRAQRRREQAPELSDRHNDFDSHHRKQDAYRSQRRFRKSGNGRRHRTHKTGTNEFGKGRGNRSWRAGPRPLHRNKSYRGRGKMPGN